MTEPENKHKSERCVEAPPLTVLYDGACPLCRREIGIYRGLRPNSPVCFADVNDSAQPLPPDTTREQLLARFHVRSSDGQLLSGAQAFLHYGRRCRAGAGWHWLVACRARPGRWSVRTVFFCAGDRRYSAWRPGWTVAFRPADSRFHLLHLPPPMTSIALIADDWSGQARPGGLGY